METILDTTNWVKYPFSVNGVDFLSLINPDGEFYSKVERLPKGVFTIENIRMVKHLIGDPAKMTRPEIENKLADANQYASSAILALA
jgi:hypothetical protein